MVFAVVRVRGRVGIRPEIKRTLELLSLTRVNHCVLLPETPQFKGMLQKCKDYITWGEVEEDVLRKVILKRGRLPGNKRVQPESLNVDEVVKGVMEGRKLSDFGLKKVLRLRPPRHGYKSIKRHYPRGALGYRGKDINDLLRRMV